MWLVGVQQISIVIDWHGSGVDHPWKGSMLNLKQSLMILCLKCLTSLMVRFLLYLISEIPSCIFLYLLLFLFGSKAGIDGLAFFNTPTLLLIAGTDRAVAETKQTLNLAQ